MELEAIGYQSGDEQVVIRRSLILRTEPAKAHAGQCSHTEYLTIQRRLCATSLHIEIGMVSLLALNE